MRNPLPKEFQERPHCVRMTITLPFDLGEYVGEQAKRFPNLRGDSNQSAFLRELVLAHRVKFCRKKGKA